MEVLYRICCGLDVHKKIIVACLITTPAEGTSEKKIRRFGTMTKDIHQLKDWLEKAGCEHVAMESTGVYWKPIYNILEGDFHILVVNARDMKAVPGRKTDVHDAEWIADLLRHGLLKASLIPTKEQRQLRDLTRLRTSMIADRARYVNRLQKILEDANIKLASVATNVMGKSAQMMLEAIISGEEDPEKLASMAKGLLRKKLDALIGALEGNFSDHHRFCLAQILNQIHHLDRSIENLNRRIEEAFRPFEDAVVRLDGIVGIGRRLAEVFLSEFGLLIDHFPTHRHLGSWAKICPGMNESAGKHRNGSITDGNKWLRAALIEAANAAKQSPNSYFNAQYHRIASRRGSKKATVAVGHSILVTAYHVLKEGTEYHDLGVRYFDEREREAVEKRLVKRLGKLGYVVNLTPVSNHSVEVFS